MTREIKFRAWDDRNKVWLCGYEHPNLGGFSLLGETILLGEWSGVLERFLMGRDGYEPEDLIVMQYTGLKDKNGKEIYEGDIIATSNDAEDGCDAWGKEENGYVKVSIDVNGVHFGNWCWQDEYSMTHVKYCEVVGNEFENPELLK